MRANGNDSATTADRLRSPLGKLSLTTWDLARNWSEHHDSSRARIIFLRAHKRLQEANEEQLEIPAAHRSLLEIQDESRLACLLVHGATGSPDDLRILARHLYQHGMTVYAPLLPISGDDKSLLPTISWRASLQEVRLRFRLLRRVHRRVHVVGFGFGASLAIHLARREPVTSLALLAPALVPRVSIIERLFLRWKLHRLRWLQPRMGWDPEILEAMESARTQVPRLRIPIYAAQCEDDERISPISLRVTQKRARHKASRFRIFPTGGHRILATHGEPSLHAEILRFFKGKDK